MNHVVTVGGILGTLGIIVGFLVACFGLLMLFAGGMSDAPVEGEAAGRKGCAVALIGLFIIIAGVRSLFW
jgi:hypothetical protein